MYKTSDVEHFIAQIPNLTCDDFVADTVTPLEELKSNAETQMKCKTELYFTYLQAKVLKELEGYEPVKRFRIDPWHDANIGGGITCALQEGDVFDKACVSISVISGKLNASHHAGFKSRGKVLNEDQLKYFVTGISIIIHPKNPFVPSIHANYRYFETFNENGQVGHWWFGGGCDLTPTYLNENDAIHFHKTHKEVCDKHDKNYQKFKKAQDDYHYNEIRGEHRGIGGFVFNDLDEGSAQQCFEFVVSCCNAILPSYLPIVKKHMQCDYNEKHVRWQQLRRGRYVEYNLLCDRGVRFGLSTPGVRIESVMLSLPLNASWEYMADPAPGSEEDKLVQVLKHPRDWV